VTTTGRVYNLTEMGRELGVDRKTVADLIRVKRIPVYVRTRRLVLADEEALVVLRRALKPVREPVAAAS
jgi:hypothetical protein